MSDPTTEVDSAATAATTAKLSQLGSQLDGMNQGMQALASAVNEKPTVDPRISEEAQASRARLTAAVEIGETAIDRQQKVSTRLAEALVRNTTAIIERDEQGGAGIDSVDPAPAPGTSPPRDGHDSPPPNGGGHDEPPTTGPPPADGEDLNGGGEQPSSPGPDPAPQDPPTENPAPAPAPTAPPRTMQA